MNGPTATAAAPRLAERRGQLERLRAELEQITNAIERQKEALGQSVVNADPEATQKKIRLALADLEARRIGLRAGLPRVEAEIEPLDREVAEAERVELEAEADRLEEEARTLKVEAENELRGFAAKFAVTWDRMQRTYGECKEARSAELRAAGAHPEDVWRAESKNRMPVLGSWGAEQAFSHVAAALVNYAPKPEP